MPREIKPVTHHEYLDFALSSKPIPIDRALATYADKTNWHTIDIEGRCYWVMGGCPTTPPYKLAQHALDELKEA